MMHSLIRLGTFACHLLTHIYLILPLERPVTSQRQRLELATAFGPMQMGTGLEQFSITCLFTMLRFAVDCGDYFQKVSLSWAQLNAVDH